MAAIQVESVSDSFEGADSAVVRAALEACILADAMGLLDSGPDIRDLDAGLLRRVANAAAKAGIASSAAARLRRRNSSPDELAHAVFELRDALERSPCPGTEWPSLSKLLGPEGLAGLLGVSPVSLRRYSSGERTTPDAVAARLHFLASVVAHLKGAYNEIGVRRWFQRPRSALGRRTPAEQLSGPWDPDGPGPQKVAELARSLSGSPAT